MGNCLITKLKGVVNNDNLEKYDYLRLNINIPEGNSGVVSFVGINGNCPRLNVHLSAVVDKIMIYPLATLYVCVLSDDTVSTGLPSHQSTVYAFAKYLLIFKV